MWAGSGGTGGVNASYNGEEGYEAMDVVDGDDIAERWDDRHRDKQQACRRNGLTLRSRVLPD